VHYRNGTQAVLSMVAFEAHGWKKALKRHFGAAVLSQGNMMIALIQDRSKGGA
jgi:hypothetical protein